MWLLVSYSRISIDFVADSHFVGGTAAGIQTPAVVAGSWFALCQSAAAGGAGLGVVSAVTQAGGAVVAGAGGLLAWMGKK